MKGKFSLLAIHLLVPLAFLCLPYIFAPGGFSTLKVVNQNPHERTNLLSYLLMLAFFYLNYYGLIPHLFFRKKYVFFLTSVLGCLAGIVGLLLVLDRQEILLPPPPIQRPHRPRNDSPILRRAMPPPRDIPVVGQQKPYLGFELSQTLFLFLVGFFVSLSLRINNRWREAEREKLNAELSYLKAQINPHFLFNTLNSLYALAIEKSDRTPEAIVKLSSLMRYVIRDAKSQQVPLAKELEYIRHYVDLQRLRLDDTVPVEFTTEGGPNGQQIAPLILISFIENAFKYGANPEEQSLIRIRIALVENDLHLFVFNRKVRMLHYEETSSGIGLSNTRYVFEDTYQEFLMQSQLYNPEKKFTTFQELVDHNPSAQKLPFLVSAAALPYLAQRKNTLYEVKDLHGKYFLQFDGYHFEILESSVKDKSAHKIALTLFSEELTWLDTIENKLLVAVGNVTEKLLAREPVETTMCMLPENALISSLQWIGVIPCQQELRTLDPVSK